MDLEIAAMVCDVLADEGLKAYSVADGDERCLDADVALLVGDCLEFDRTADLLRDSTRRRPRTVLWQLHALPPPDLPESVVSSGLRVADALHRVQSKGKLGRALVGLRGYIPRISESRCDPFSMPGFDAPHRGIRGSVNGSSMRHPVSSC